MKSKNIKILAIESSCDETAAAVISGVVPDLVGDPLIVDSRLRGNDRFRRGNDRFRRGDDNPKILSNIVSSQVDLHALTGGVVPEVASRAHVKNIIPVISEALISASQKIFKSQSTISKQISNDKSQNKINGNCKLIIDKYPDAIKYLRQEIDYIAVTAGPGLIGSLLVGFNAAKTLAYALNKPIVPINHIEGHIYSALSRIELPITNNQLPIKSQFPNPKKLGTDNCELTTEIIFPIISLTVSGGHTSLTLMKDHGKYQTLGETLDDAAGEAFDKVAKLLDLGYPGGPAVSKLASQFRQKWATDKTNHEKQGSVSGSLISRSIMNNVQSGIVFPRPIINDGTFNFSFSGLKTAVLQKVLEIKRDILISSHPELVSGSQKEMLKQVQHDILLSNEIKEEVCAAFEDAVVDVLVTKTMRATEKYKPRAVILAGGVAANRTLRESLEYRIKNYKLQTTGYKLDLLVPPMNLCGDNAAMIGLAAYYHILRNDISTWKNIEVNSNLELK